MMRNEQDIQQLKSEILREMNQQQFQQRQEILKLQQMIIDREEKSREYDLKVSSFDGKLLNLKNILTTELNHTRDNLLQEPKKIMRDFEMNIKHIYDMKFKSLETQFIGIMEEQSKLNRLTEQDSIKRSEECTDYYQKLDKLIHIHTEKQDSKIRNVIDDILNKFNKMEDTFLELFKQKEKLFERMNLGYEHLFSNQEIIESTIKKIIYTLDRKADNLSVRTYLKNVKLDLDTKFEDLCNTNGFQYGLLLKGDTGGYLKERTNQQSGILENININTSDLKVQQEGVENNINNNNTTIQKLIQKSNQQSSIIKQLKETQIQQEKRIDHLEEIQMNLKLNDFITSQQDNQLIPHLKQRVPIYINEEHGNNNQINNSHQINNNSMINQTPFQQKNKQNSRNNSPQIDQTYSQHFMTDAKSIHQKSDFKDKDSSIHYQKQTNNSIINDIFNKKSADSNNNNNNNNLISNQQNKSNVQRNLIYEAYDQSTSPQINKEDDEERKKVDQNNQKVILQNNFIHETKDKIEKLPQCLEQDEGEEINQNNQKNGIQDIEKLKLIKSVGQERITSTNVPNRMRQQFDQKNKKSTSDLKSNSIKNNNNNNDNSDLLKETEPLDQGFMDIGEEILTNSLKKPTKNNINNNSSNQKKDESIRQSNNQSKKPSLMLDDIEQNNSSYNNRKNNNNIQQTNSRHSPQEQYNNNEDEDESVVSGGGLRSLLNKSKKRSDMSRETSPIQNQRSNSRNNLNNNNNMNNNSNFNNLNEINLLNSDYKGSQIMNKNQSYLSQNNSQYNNNNNINNNNNYMNNNNNSNYQQNQTNYLQKSSLLDNKSNLSKGGGLYGNNLNRQGEYFDHMNQEVFENPLDRKSPLLKKSDMSNSSLMRNKMQQQNQQKLNDLPPLNIKSAKEISRSKPELNRGIGQKSNFSKGMYNNNNNNNNMNKNQNRNMRDYQDGMYDQRNEGVQYGNEEDEEEVVYQIDEDGFLMDEQGEYLRDEEGNFIRLSPDQLDNLRDQNLVVEEDLY